MSYPQRFCIDCRMEFTAKHERQVCCAGDFCTLKGVNWPKFNKAHPWPWWREVIHVVGQFFGREP